MNLDFAEEDIKCRLCGCTEKESEEKYLPFIDCDRCKQRGYRETCGQCDGVGGWWECAPGMCIEYGEDADEED